MPWLKCRRIHAFDEKNPQIFSGYKTVTLDGVTENKNIIPGMSIVLSSLAEDGDIFEIGIGCYWYESGGSWIRVLNLGIGLAGYTSTPKTVKAYNNNGYDMQSCKVYATNAIRLVNTEAPDRPFKAFRQTGATDPTADSDLLGDTISFDNVGGGTCDILVGGSPIDIYDVTGDYLKSGGTGLSMDGSNVYRFNDTTKYQSGEFVLSASLTATDTASIFVSDGGEQIEIDGGAGFVAGPAGATLTEDGENDGVVTDGGYAEFDMRASPAGSETPDLNMRLFSVRIIGVQV